MSAWISGKQSLGWRHETAEEKIEQAKYEEIGARRMLLDQRRKVRLKSMPSQNEKE